MNKWNLIIDVAKCHDCNNCFLACKDEYYENDFPPYSTAQPRHGHRWIDILRKERGQFPKVDIAYLPIPCMHCDDAPCVPESGTEAVYKRDDGIVMIDPVAAKGRKDILDTCPYGVIWWNEEEAIPQKCTLCVHLLDDGWKAPRCVQACPTGALRIEHIEDPEMQKLVESSNLKVYKPQYKTKPRVYYQNLYRFTKYFIAGNVVLNDIDECAEAAEVTLKDISGMIVDTTVTDSFGDFKLDNLENESSKYRLEFAYSGYREQAISIELVNSINIGAIFLNRHSDRT